MRRQWLALCDCIETLGLPCSRTFPERNLQNALPSRHTPNKRPPLSLASLLTQHNCQFLDFAGFLQRWTAAVACLPCATTTGMSSSSLKTRTSPFRSTKPHVISRATRVSYLISHGLQPHKATYRRDLQADNINTDGHELPTLRTYIGSLKPEAPFRISIHHWGPPKPSSLIQEVQRKAGTKIIFAVQVIIDNTKL